MHLSEHKAKKLSAKTVSTENQDTTLSQGRKNSSISWDQGRQRVRTNHSFFHVKAMMDEQNEPCLIQECFIASNEKLPISVQETVQNVHQPNRI